MAIRTSGARVFGSSMCSTMLFHMICGFSQTLNNLICDILPVAGFWFSHCYTNSCDSITIWWEQDIFQICKKWPREFFFLNCCWKCLLENVSSINCVVWFRCSSFSNHSNINLYNNYASASYATYTAPQYTTANPNRCPANANIKPTSSDSCGDHSHATNAINTPQKSIHENNNRNGNSNANASDAVAASKHEHTVNESVIEEGQHNNIVSTLYPIWSDSAEAHSSFQLGGCRMQSTHIFGIIINRHSICPDAAYFNPNWMEFCVPLI